MQLEVHSNEAIVREIQEGKKCYLPILWEKIELFVLSRANKYISQFNSPNFEIGDLYNSAYIYFVEAVYKYDYNSEKTFVGFLASYYLPKAFASAAGISTEKLKRDPINSALSLDAPCNATPELTIGDMIADPQDSISSVDDKLTNQELRHLLDELLATLPERENDILCLYYYGDLSVEEISKKLSIPVNDIRTYKSAALKKLRKPSITKRKLLEYTDFYTNYYARTGVRSQRSPVELIVDKRESIRNKLNNKFIVI